MKIVLTVIRPCLWTRSAAVDIKDWSCVACGQAVADGPPRSIRKGNAGAPPKPAGLARGFPSSSFYGSEPEKLQMVRRRSTVRVRKGALVRGLAHKPGRRRSGDRTPAGPHRHTCRPGDLPRRRRVRADGQHSVEARIGRASRAGGGQRRGRAAGRRVLRGHSPVTLKGVTAPMRLFRAAR